MSRAFRRALEPHFGVDRDSLGAPISVSPAAPREGALSRCRPGLGTLVRVTLQGAADEAGLLSVSQAAFAEVARLERLLSFHDPASELNRLHHLACQGPIEVSEETAEVLSLALELGHRSAGAFDPTVAGRMVALGELPDHGFPVDRAATFRDIELSGRKVSFGRPLLLDLGGIAKGYIVDRALATIPAELEAVVDAGGDLRMRPWRGRSIGVRVPSSTSARGVRAVPMKAAAVATTAAYFNGGVSRVRDPRSGDSVPGTESVSVFAASCALADALTKVALLVPESDVLWRDLEVSVLWVLADASCRWSQAA